MAGNQKTLLELVQNVLSAIESDPVNFLSDSHEGEMVAEAFETVFYEMISTRIIPEHFGLVKLHPFSDSTQPTSFIYNAGVDHVTQIWYDNRTGIDDVPEYRPVSWLTPTEFLLRSDGMGTPYREIPEPVSGTTLRIKTDMFPRFYTSFDDKNIIMDGFREDIDDTLQETKTRVMARTIPEFNRFDEAFIPKLDDDLVPYFLAETTSRVQSLHKGGPDAKTDQASRRQKYYLQNNRFRTSRPNPWSPYGRHR